MEGEITMEDNILKETETKMEKALENTKEKFSSIRAGRASVAMLDGITIEAYGSPAPIS